LPDTPPNTEVNTGFPSLFPQSRLIKRCKKGC
jgi:hypothetical protein